MLVVVTLGCAPEMPKSLDLEGERASPPLKMDLPPADDPCTRACFETLQERMHAPPVDCSNPAIPAAGCIQPPRSDEIVRACETICRAPTGAKDCREIVSELRDGCEGPCRFIRTSPDVQAHCRRQCVREKFGPALPTCTKPYF